MSQPDPDMKARAERFASVIGDECDDYTRRNMPAEYRPGFAPYMREFVKNRLLPVLIEQNDATVARVFVIPPHSEPVER